MSLPLTVLVPVWVWLQVILTWSRFSANCLALAKCLAIEILPVCQRGWFGHQPNGLFAAVAAIAVLHYWSDYRALRAWKTKRLKSQISKMVRRRVATLKGGYVKPELKHYISLDVRAIFVEHGVGLLSRDDDLHRHFGKRCRTAIVWASRLSSWY